MKKNIEEQIKNLTTQLLELAAVTCWNDISKNLVFILSNISEVKGDDFFTQRINRNKINNIKTPKSFNEAITDLKEIYDSIYDARAYRYIPQRDARASSGTFNSKLTTNPSYFVISNRVRNLRK